MIYADLDAIAEGRAKHGTSRRRHAHACSAWDPSTQPTWLTSEVFSQQIQPLLADIPTSIIRSRIGVSRWYAGKIRRIVRALKSFQAFVLLLS
jgi:hypothetical protein